MQTSRVFGILLQPAAGFCKEIRALFLAKRGLTELEVKKMISERATARQEKNYQRGDEIRDRLLEQGIVLRDSAERTEWDVLF